MRLRVLEGLPTMNRIPCTECRKRKQTEDELKELKSNYKKLERKTAHRLHKIGDLEDTIKRLRESVKALRKMERRFKERYEALHELYEDSKLRLRTLKLKIKKAMEE